MARVKMVVKSGGRIRVDAKDAKVAKKSKPKKSSKTKPEGKENVN